MDHDEIRPAPVVDAETGEVYSVGAGYWFTVAIFIVFAHGIDAIMTHHFGMKEHYPP